MAARERRVDEVAAQETRPAEDEKSHRGSLSTFAYQESCEAVVEEVGLFEVGPVGAVVEHDELRVVAEGLTGGGEIGDEGDVVAAPEDERGGRDVLRREGRRGPPGP